MEGSPRIEEHDEVSSVCIDGEPISTPLPNSSLHAPFKQPSLAKEPALKKVKVEPGGDLARKLYLSPDEEKALISTMKDLALEGWKAGQGWKRGTYHKAAKMVQSLVPGCRNSAKNVENKLHNWGKQYRLLHEFLSLSGVAIDQETYAVVTDSDEQWRELQKEQKLSKLVIDPAAARDFERPLKLHMKPEDQEENTTSNPNLGTHLPPDPMNNGFGKKPSSDEVYNP